MPPFVLHSLQIAEWIDKRTLDKARGYRDAVIDVAWDGSTLRGKVQGTARRPYDVWIAFTPTGTGLDMVGHCSCPVGYDCKHVAAVLIEATSEEHVPSDALRPRVLQWIEDMQARFSAANQRGRASASGAEQIAYVLQRGEWPRGPAIRLFKLKVTGEGVYRLIGKPLPRPLAANRHAFIAPDDAPIVRGLWLAQSEDVDDTFLLHGAMGAEMLQRALATRRLFVQPDYDSAHLPLRPLHAGPDRPATIAWLSDQAGQVRPALVTDPSSSFVIPTEPTWYIDAHAGEAGVASLPDLSLPPLLLASFLNMPALSQAEAPVAAAVFAEIAPGLPAPPMREGNALRVVDVEPVPFLTLESLTTPQPGRPRAKPKTLDFATFGFDYGGMRIDPASTDTLFNDAGGGVVQVQRRHEQERQYLKQLDKAGLTARPPDWDFHKMTMSERLYQPLIPEYWRRFLDNAVPALKAAGWRIDIKPGFRFEATEIETIEGTAERAADGWFDLAMEITVDNRKIRLDTLLPELFRRDPRWLSGQLDAIADDEAVMLTTDRGERLRLRALRLKPVVRVLVDLFDDLAGQPGAGALRVSPYDVARIEALTAQDGESRWHFEGDPSFRALVQHRQTGAAVPEAVVPAGLRATLRPYQHEGLGWMQFLREHDLAGVLADDMGLGKTIQTLAHILAEKESGRLDRPALIAMPATLIHNWRDEAARFAPDLRVLDLTGPQRKDRFTLIDDHDLVLTNFALLWRDEGELAAHAFHLLILDEAQYVKNAASRSAAVIRNLNARHRLCLTGTPLENHLGELWAQFDFLLPGFLGSSRDFQKRWRAPIEKGGDTVRRDLLAGRIRPFMLRRRKSEVAAELPPKTVIVQSVDLDGAQRDLYETVRAAMQERVRAAVAEKGLSRSHIVVLDALLKLRQICCDPRLFKLTNTGQHTASAKLDLLCEMVPKLIDEGRRVLLFSQFTGMLALIAAAFDRIGVSYVMLTGDTADRAAPVRQFQQGEVPLFLISLRAGGVGLNLTAADTVIHYDPWWNPAAEAQATDRAHRIGQDKPVFVYKLIVADSIEEKIVAMQDDKAALAASILSEDAAGATKFSTADLDALLAPMPGVPSRAVTGRAAAAPAGRKRKSS